VLTERQRQILAFIEGNDPPPTTREIAAHFGFKTTGTVAQYLATLRAKGFLERGTGQARSLKPVGSYRDQRGTIVHIPLYGSIPAGFADERHQDAEGCVSVDAQSLGIRPTKSTFALRVKGDSMIDKQILNGDIAVLEHSKSAKPGDVVAALIDNESTLKVYLKERGKVVLRAANPKYKDLIPATELVIQGVMIGLVRSCRAK
jgi:repressor LexA